MPVDVFDVAAAIAEEVVMLFVLRVIAGGTAFGGDLAHEARFDEVAEVVVGGCAGGARVNAVDGFEDFGSGGMLVMLEQKRHDAVTLRSKAQAAIFESLSDLLRTHRRLDYV